jgi:hypothetical protein
MIDCLCAIAEETIMKLKMLAGAAAVAALVASPAMAKSHEKLSAHQSAHQIGVKKMKTARAYNKTQSRHMQMQMRESNASVGPRGSGFPPLDFAAGVAGGAVNTAGAIAGGAVNAAGAVAGGAVSAADSAVVAPFRPFRGDSYAYARDASTFPSRGYIADANGPSCLPGQMTTINGHRLTCQ